jgi:hypothetical protein
MTTRIPKYGIPFHTIKYWQDQATLLYRYNGLYAGRGELERSAPTLGSRGVGHAVISLAAVASPEHLKAVLNGTRGRRWQ